MQKKTVLEKEHNLSSERDESNFWCRGAQNIQYLTHESWTGMLFEKFATV